MAMTKKLEQDRLLRRLVLSALAVVLLAATLSVYGQSQGDPILRGFQDPPDSAKPRVWWHWMNGNVSKEGIKADLEWMKRVGIGGFQNFDGGRMGGADASAQKRVAFLSPEWKDALKYAATLADQLGLEMARASSPGWSETGGPWVKPEQGMKKFVWTETRVEGGKPFTGKLAQPPGTTGPFQNIAGSGNAQGAETPSQYGPWYADAAVVAFRLPDAAKSLAELQPTITSSGGSFALAASDRWRLREDHAAARGSHGREGLDSVRIRRAANGLWHVAVLGHCRSRRRTRRRRQQPESRSQR